MIHHVIFPATRCSEKTRLSSFPAGSTQLHSTADSCSQVCGEVQIRSACGLTLERPACAASHHSSSDTLFGWQETYLISSSLHMTAPSCSQVCGEVQPGTADGPALERAA